MNHVNNNNKQYGTNRGASSDAPEHRYRTLHMSPEPYAPHLTEHLPASIRIGIYKKQLSGASRARRCLSSGHCMRSARRQRTVKRPLFSKRASARSMTMTTNGGEVAAYDPATGGTSVRFPVEIGACSLRRLPSDSIEFRSSQHSSH